VQRRRFERNEFVKKPETERTRITDIKVATQNETQPSLCSSVARCFCCSLDRELRAHLPDRPGRKNTRGKKEMLKKDV
jgi:hypothetical protein